VEEKTIRGGAKLGSHNSRGLLPEEFQRNSEGSKLRKGTLFLAFEPVKEDNGRKREKGRALHGFGKRKKKSQTEKKRKTLSGETWAGRLEKSFCCRNGGNSDGGYVGREDWAGKTQFKANRTI